MIVLGPPGRSARGRRAWCWWSCFPPRSCGRISDRLRAQCEVKSVSLTCSKSKAGSMRARSAWLMMKKSPTFQDWMLMADLVSTQLRIAKYVAYRTRDQQASPDLNWGILTWSRRRTWISSRNGNSSGSWVPWVTMSLITSGIHLLLRWTRIYREMGG